MQVVVIIGGFLHSKKEPNAVSTDVAALEEARRYATKHRIDLKECYEAWIPEPSLDSRPGMDARFG